MLALMKKTRVGSNYSKEMPGYSNSSPSHDNIIIVEVRYYIDK